LILSGCISTHVRDFTDPEYTSFSSHKLLVITPNQKFDDIFIGMLKDENIDVVAHKYSDIFLRTRKYTNDEMANIVRLNGYDSLIYIVISGDRSNNQVVSYMTTSSAQAYSSGYNSAYATGNSTTIPITAHTRNTNSTAELYDPLTHRKIWVADLETEASGSLYVQNDDTMESISEEVINTLIRKGHFRKIIKNEKLNK